MIEHLREEPKTLVLLLDVMLTQLDLCFNWTHKVFVARLLTDPGVIVYIDHFLPADYNTADHLYGLKVNKNQVWWFIDYKLVAVFLFNVPEGNPEWHAEGAKNPPYALGVTKHFLPTSLPLGIWGVDSNTSFKIGATYESGNPFIVSDGDPNPPIQFCPLQ